MNLYCITIRSGNSFYVVAEDETSAYQRLLSVLDTNDLYFTNERKLKTIELIAERYYENGVFSEIY